jgi:hypothetical protein
MGLDISHDAWHGAYSAFSRWRNELAKIASFPPLALMEGFYNPIDWQYRFRNETSHRLWQIEIESYLPIKWDKWQDDPLTVLLYHSDCEGIIESKYLLPLADRIETLLDKLPTEKDSGHIGDWKEKTQKFINGCRLAASKDQDLEFY